MIALESEQNRTYRVPVLRDTTSFKKRHNKRKGHCNVLGSFFQKIFLEILTFLYKLVNVLLLLTCLAIIHKNGKMYSGCICSAPATHSLCAPSCFLTMLTN